MFPYIFRSDFCWFINKDLLMLLLNVTSTLEIGTYWRLFFYFVLRFINNLEALFELHSSLKHEGYLICTGSGLKLKVRIDRPELHSHELNMPCQRPGWKTYEQPKSGNHIDTPPRFNQNLQHVHSQIISGVGVVGSCFNFLYWHISVA